MIYLSSKRCSRFEACNHVVCPWKIRQVDVKVGRKLLNEQLGNEIWVKFNDVTKLTKEKLQMFDTVMVLCNFQWPSKNVLVILYMYIYVCLYLFIYIFGIFSFLLFTYSFYIFLIISLYVAKMKLRWKLLVVVALIALVSDN